MMFDYIIVGGGTAGCVLANRLCADPDCEVLLLEAGGHPKGLWPRMPAGTAKMFNRGPYNWGFETEPEKELHNRRIYAPRGKGLGGSSLINGMVFGRGQAQDYDDWAQFGVRGWSWSDVLPHFKAIESREAGDACWRGLGGELSIVDPGYVHPASADFVAACTQAGIAPNPDFNGALGNAGAGLLQFNIRAGQRHSAAHAFLQPVKSRRNLHVLDHCQATRLLLDGMQAVGVAYKRAGVELRAKARREVIVAAGAFGSPALLMHSGIGNAALLADKGVATVHHLPGVGENLQDHFYTHSIFDCTPDSSLNRDFSGWRQLLHGIQYLLTHSGALTMGASQAAAFVTALPGSTRPDTQINFKPVTWSRKSDGSVAIVKTPQFCAAACFLRPVSRGQVAIGSGDPLSAPVIRANYLSASQDQQAVLNAFRIARQIFAQPALRQRVIAEHLPGAAVQDDAALLDHVRRHGASMHHWAGSCRMGNDANAVVDERLRVHGMARLRVVDASVFPLIPSTNTNAPTFMLADRAAKLMLEDAQHAILV